MSLHLTEHRGGFAPGRTEITRLDEAQDGTGIGFAVHVLAPGDRIEETVASETAYLMMSGEVRVRGAGQESTWKRDSLFDELPTTLHVAAGEHVEIEAVTAAEIDSFTTANDKTFAPRLYLPSGVRNERRGEGQVADACFRFVRTIFDDTNTDPNCELVLGEVVTLPGRWSSYPPHHHPQPEIYHYRFSAPQGYGHAELGETVLKVRHNDTVKIFDGNDHAQAAAPGYGMWYAWVIRHLPGKRYDVPEFTAEHTWTMRADADFWWPKL